MSVGASFALAGASVAVAMKDKDNGEESISANVGYAISGVSLGLTYEVNTGTTNEDDAAVRFDAGYGLGGGMKASLRIDSSMPDVGDGVTGWRLMMSKSF